MYQPYIVLGDSAVEIGKPVQSYQEARDIAMAEGLRRKMKTIEYKVEEVTTNQTKENNNG